MPDRIAPSRTALLVTCHPDPASLCGQAARTIAAALSAGGTALAHHDLEAIDFKAAIGAGEYAGYAQGQMPQDVEPLARELGTAEMLVFVFPVWMYAMPARLKGYFDRVWRPGVSFAFTPQGLEPLLTGVRHLRVIATHGATAEETARDGDATDLYFKTAIPSVLPRLESNLRFDFYGLDRPNKAHIEAQLEKLRVHFERLGKG